MKKYIGALVALLVLTASAACGASADPIASEVELGKYVAAQFAKEFRFTKTPENVQDIFDKLAAGLERPLPYNIKVIKDKNPNAFCIPGGNIYITTGMINFVRNDDELAAVLAHELIHAGRGHLVTMIERGQKVTVVALVSQLTSSKKGVAKILNRVYKAAANASASHEFEREADVLSVELLSKTGFDASAPLSLMENISAKYARASRATGTHPAIAARMADVRNAIAQL